MSEDGQMLFARRLYLLLTLCQTRQLYTAKNEADVGGGLAKVSGDGNCVHDGISRVEL